jgi:hypothetical protein
LHEVWLRFLQQPPLDNVRVRLKITLDIAAGGSSTDIDDFLANRSSITFTLHHLLPPTVHG